ncbi:MAG: hypothetical protein ROR55_23135 [Devosia sp.]
MTFTDKVQYGAPRRDWLSLFGDGFAQMLAPAADGRMETMAVEVLNDEGFGTFTRGP